MIDGDDYQRRQALISAGLTALVVRLMRKFGIPLGVPAKRQFAQRILPDVQLARAESYAMATRYMQYTAAVADQALPDIAPIEPYGMGALVDALERTTEPVEQLAQAVRTATSKPSAVSIIDRRTGLPFVDLDEAPSDPRVIIRIADNTGAAVARHANQAGRNAVIMTAQQGGHRIGWARVIESGNPCAFCGMLASRGPIYKSERAAAFEAHDRCQCRATLVYAGQPWDGQEQWQRWQSMWNTATKGYSGRDALNAFRRSLYAQQHGNTHVGAARGRSTAPRAARPRQGLESAADIARRHLPTLHKSLDSLREKGFAENSAPVQFHLSQIRRHSAALAH